MSNRVYLMRHGEKQNGDHVNLSLAGLSRSVHLVEYFRENFPGDLPTKIYAMKQADKNHSNRSYQTVAPLAQQLELTINSDYLKEDAVALAKDILKLFKSSKESEVILVCFEHDELPAIARTLINTNSIKGWNPKNYKDKTLDLYNFMWIVDFNESSIKLSTMSTFDVNKKNGLVDTSNLTAKNIITPVIF